MDNSDLDSSLKRRDIGQAKNKEGSSEEKKARRLLSSRVGSAILALLEDGLESFSQPDVTLSGSQNAKENIPPISNIKVGCLDPQSSSFPTKKGGTPIELSREWTRDLVAIKSCPDAVQSLLDKLESDANTLEQIRPHLQKYILSEIAKTTQFPLCLYTRMDKLVILPFHLVLTTISADKDSGKLIQSFVNIIMNSFKNDDCDFERIISLLITHAHSDNGTGISKRIARLIIDRLTLGSEDIERLPANVQKCCVSIYDHVQRFGESFVQDVFPHQLLLLRALFLQSLDKKYFDYFYEIIRRIPDEIILEEISLISRRAARESGGSQYWLSTAILIRIACNKSESLAKQILILAYEICRCAFESLSDYQVLKVGLKIASEVFLSDYGLKENGTGDASNWYCDWFRLCFTKGTVLRNAKKNEDGGNRTELNPNNTTINSLCDSIVDDLVKSSKPNVVFLLAGLTKTVPEESADVLKLQVREIRPHRTKYPSEVKDFIDLARTRILDVEDSKPLSTQGILGGSSTSLQNFSTSNNSLRELSGFLEKFENSNNIIPAKLIEIIRFHSGGSQWLSLRKALLAVPSRDMYVSNPVLDPTLPVRLRLANALSSQNMLSTREFQDFQKNCENILSMPTKSSTVGSCENKWLTSITSVLENMPSKLRPERFGANAEKRTSVCLLPGEFQEFSQLLVELSNSNEATKEKVPVIARAILESVQISLAKVSLLKLPRGFLFNGFTAPLVKICKDVCSIVYKSLCSFIAAQLSEFGPILDPLQSQTLCHVILSLEQEDIQTITDTTVAVESIRSVEVLLWKARFGCMFIQTASINLDCVGLMSGESNDSSKSLDETKSVYSPIFIQGMFWIYSRISYYKHLELNTHHDIEYDEKYAIPLGVLHSCFVEIWRRKDWIELLKISKVVGIDKILHQEGFFEIAEQEGMPILFYDSIEFLRFSVIKTISNPSLTKDSFLQEWRHLVSFLLKDSVVCHTFVSHLYSEAMLLLSRLPDYENGCLRLCQLEGNLSRKDMKRCKFIVQSAFVVVDNMCEAAADLPNLNETDKDNSNEATTILLDMIDIIFETKCIPGLDSCISNADEITDKNLVYSCFILARIVSNHLVRKCPGMVDNNVRILLLEHMRDFISMNTSQSELVRIYKMDTNCLLPPILYLSSIFHDISGPKMSVSDAFAIVKFLLNTSLDLFLPLLSLCMKERIFVFVKGIVPRGNHFLNCLAYLKNIINALESDTLSSETYSHLKLNTSIVSHIVVGTLEGDASLDLDRRLRMAEYLSKGPSINNSHDISFFFPRLFEAFLTRLNHLIKKLLRHEDSIKKPSEGHETRKMIGQHVAFALEMLIGKPHLFNCFVDQASSNCAGDSEAFFLILSQISKSKPLESEIKDIAGVESWFETICTFLLEAKSFAFSKDESFAEAFYSSMEEVLTSAPDCVVANLLQQFEKSRLPLLYGIIVECASTKGLC